MTSVDFNFAEPIASYDDSVDASMDVYPTDIGSIKRSDYVVLNGRPVEVVEATHSKPGKHGHAKAHLIGIDIFTSRRYEAVRPCGYIIQVPRVTKQDYIVTYIDEDNYVSLMNESKCNDRCQIRLHDDSEMAHRLLGKYNEGDGQIKVTVLKALGEEQIIAFKVIE